MPKRVVLDCNLLISALMRADSLPARAFDLARNAYEIVVSEPCFNELKRIFYRPKFARYFSKEEADLFLEVFQNVATSIKPTEIITACRDPKDDKYLELAVAAEANFIVTGDADLLVLHPFRGVSIISPRAFLEIQAANFPF